MGCHRGRTAFFSWRSAPDSARAAARRALPPHLDRRPSHPQPAALLLWPRSAPRPARALGPCALLGGALCNRWRADCVVVPTHFEAGVLYLSEHRQEIYATVLRDRANMRGAMRRMACERRNRRPNAAQALLGWHTLPRDATRCGRGPASSG